MSATGCSAAPRLPGASPQAAGEAVIRPLGPGDHDVLGALYAELSPRARFLRFGSGTPPLSQRRLARMVELDWWDRAAWGAFAEGVCVGEARLERLDAARSEVAVTVAEGWRRRGLGRRLLRTAAAWAWLRGDERLVVAVHPENRAAAAFVREVLGVVPRDRGGLLEAEATVAQRAAGAGAVASRG